MIDKISELPLVAFKVMLTAELTNFENPAQLRVVSPDDFNGQIKLIM